MGARAPRSPCASFVQSRRWPRRAAAATAATATALSRSRTPPFSHASQLSAPRLSRCLPTATRRLLCRSFCTVHCGVVQRRDAARALNEGAVFASFSMQTDSDARSPKGSAVAAEEVAQLAPLINTRFAVLEAGAYWGAYKPVLAALQTTGGLSTMPLGDCLMQAQRTDRPPPYLSHAAAPLMRSKKPSLTDLVRAGSGRAVSRGVSPTSSIVAGEHGTYDIRPMLNLTDQSTPYYIADVRHDWPTVGSDGSPPPGSSLDKWQLKAANALLTRRLGLVQGPPGTGKTFVGLLVPARSSHAWSSAHMPLLAPACSRLLLPSPLPFPLLSFPLAGSSAPCDPPLGRAHAAAQLGDVGDVRGRRLTAAEPQPVGPRSLIACLACQLPPALPCPCTRWQAEPLCHARQRQRQRRGPHGGGARCPRSQQRGGWPAPAPPGRCRRGFGRGGSGWGGSRQCDD